MTRTHQLQIALAALACAGAVASAATAGGEHKNQPPFTNPVAAPTRSLASASNDSMPTGEAKNQAPFTRAVTTRSAQGVVRTGRRSHTRAAGEAKNQAPFTRKA
jgi:hypothetical protein